MMTPQSAAGALLRAVLLGLTLGAAYSLLRPPARRFPVWGDLIFLPVLLWGALVLSFGICAGDPRLPVVLAVGIGWYLWAQTAGRWLKAWISRFWQGIFRVFLAFFIPARAFLKFLRKISKKAYAIGGKWVTIKKNNRRHPQRRSGGLLRSTPQKGPRPDPSGFLPIPSAEEGSTGSRCIFYGGWDFPEKNRGSGPRPAHGPHRPE